MANDGNFPFHKHTHTILNGSTSLSNPTTTLPTTTPTTLAGNSIILSPAAIVGISVGGSVLLIFCIALSVLLWRYRRRKRAQEVKYTPWSRLNEASPHSNYTITTSTRSRPSNAVSVLEVPIPNYYLFESPVSVHSRSSPFRASPIDSRAILKSLVPHDYPVPKLPTQEDYYPHTNYQNTSHSQFKRQQQSPSSLSLNMDMPVLHVAGSSDSSPSVYESDSPRDVDRSSHRVVHDGALLTSRLNVPVSLQPRIANGFGRSLTEVDPSNNHLPQIPNPPPPVLTRDRTASDEARAIAELIKAIESGRLSAASSGVTSISRTPSRSSTDEALGIAVTAPFTNSSLYTSGNISSRSSLTTHTVLRQLTSGFPLPPEGASPSLNNFNPKI